MRTTCFGSAPNDGIQTISVLERMFFQELHLLCDWYQRFRNQRLVFRIRAPALVVMIKITLRKSALPVLSVRLALSITCGNRCDIRCVSQSHPIVKCRDERLHLWPPCSNPTYPDCTNEATCGIFS